MRVAIAVCLAVMLWGGAAPAQGADPLLDQLRALPGVKVLPLGSGPGVRGFFITLEQPIDHDNPSLGTFQQRAFLMHRDVTRPMVLTSTGYSLFSLQLRDNELSALLGANNLTIEHRYFGTSVPDSPDYRYLTIRQAAYDHHRFITLLKTVYGAKWVSTGGSKGGMTSLYHRRFFPNDVDGTVAYVAPQSFGINDQRYPLFLEHVGSAACRQRIVDFQRAVLTRRQELMPFFEQEASDFGITYSRVGGLDFAYEHAIQEFRFALWQYLDEDYCATLPGPNASAAQIVDTFNFVVGPFSLASDQILEEFGPYYYQAASQLGSYGPLELHLGTLLQHPGTYRAPRYSPVPVGHFDSAAMPEIQIWLALWGEHVILVYGQNDPWSAGAFELGFARDSFRYFVPGGNHITSFLSALPTPQRTEAFAALQRWTGVTPTPPSLQSLTGDGRPVIPEEWSADRDLRRLRAPAER
jgi:hypothetical protein